MKVFSFPYGLVQANMYVLVFDKEAIVIDPCVSWKDTDLSDLSIRAVLCTHGHFDHISALDEYGGDLTLPVFIDKNDKNMLSDPELNHSSDFGMNIHYDGAVEVFSQSEYSNEDFNISETFSLKIVSTPGHTPGSVCFLFIDQDKKMRMFTGDMLFEGSVGRTDLGGSFKDMKRSISKLKEMADDIECYPGHGDVTDLGREKRYNPYFHEF